MSAKTGKRSATRLVSCGADGRIALWEIHLNPAATAAAAAAASPAATASATAGAGAGVGAARGGVRIEQVTHEQAAPSGAGAQGLRVAEKAGMNQVAVRQDGRLAATAGWDGTVRIFDLRKQLRLLAALTYHRDGVHAVAFATPAPTTAPAPGVGGGARPFGGATDSDPWLLASGGTDGRIALWRLYPPS